MKVEVEADMTINILYNLDICFILTIELVSVLPPQLYPHVLLRPTYSPLGNSSLRFIACPTTKYSS